MNYGTFKSDTLKLLNQWSIRGNLIPLTDENTLDMVLRFPAFLNKYLQEIATSSKYIHRVKSISQNPIPNMLPNPLSCFDIIQHTDQDLTSMLSKGAKSYHFMVDGVSSWVIEEERTSGIWTELSSGSQSSPKGEYTRYKGFTGVTDTSYNVRIRFTGLYPYNVRNRALYAYVFPTVEDIPDYERYVIYEMPTNFFMLNKVVQKGQGLIYDNTLDWNWEGRNKIALNYFLVGEIDVHYHAYPDVVPENVADEYVLQLDEEACQAATYGVACEVFRTDPQNKSVSDKLYAVYQGKLANMTNVITLGSTSVKNTLFKTDSTSKLF
jgi:hypothetical protein